MPEQTTKRIPVWREILWRPATLLVSVPWFLVRAYDLYRTEFISPEKQAALQLRNWIPGPWWVWAMLSLAIALCVVLEGAYRAVRKREQELAALGETVAATDRSEASQELATNLQIAQAKIKEKDEEIERVKRRPCIVPVRYGQHSEKNFGAGLIIANDGEPAYDISIPDIPLGPSKVTITPNFTRLSKEDGERFCEIWINKPQGMMLTGSALLETMRQQDIWEVTFPIRFKDSDNRRYVTTCKLEFDATVLGGSGKVGIDVRFVGQELECVNQPK